MSQINSINNKFVNFDCKNETTKNHFCTNKIEEGMTESSSLTGLVNEIGLKLIREIGSGAFGRVYESKDKKTSKKYAVKIIQLKDNDGLQFLEVKPAFSRTSKSMELPRGEGLALVTPDHPNILKTHGVFLKNLKINAYRYVTDIDSIIDENAREAKEIVVGSVTEIVPHAKELFDFIVDRKEGLEKEEIRDIGKQIGEGLTELHHHHLSHRDLKLQNILINAQEQQIKIIDFGFMRNLKTTMRGRSDSCLGTPNMAAPELWEGTGSTQLADAWAFGVILYVMAFNQYPFGQFSDNIDEIANEVITFSGLGEKISKWNKNKIAKMTLSRDPQFCDLLDRLICSEEDRMPVKEAIEHPFFKGIQEKTLQCDCSVM